MRAAAAVVAVAVATTVAWIVIGLASSGATLAGTNSTLVGSYVGTLAPGDRLCQRREAVPANAAELEVFAGVFGRPGPPIELSIGGRVAGRRSGGYPDGWVRIPLDAAYRGGAATIVDQSICVRNRGDVRLALAGLAGAAAPATVAGKPVGGRISMRWTAAERGTWWALAPTVAQRATFGKADFGRWAPAVLVAMVWAGAFTLVLRSGR